MNVNLQVKYLLTRRLVPGLVLLSLFFGGVAGCAPASTPAALATPTLVAMPSPSPAAPVEATLPSGWESYESQAQCGYAIAHPSDMQGAGQGTYSWILSPATGEPTDAPFPNFVYVSAIPDGFQGEAGEVYNYDPVAAETLLTMQVAETKSLHDNPNAAQGFTYTRLPDTTLNDQAAQTYENTQPWEFPPGTKEIRYLLQANGCTYLIGGYMDTTGSTQSGAMNEERFNQIITTFRLKP